MLKKILIANRSEIALRIIRSARELSIKTAVIYAKEDEDNLFVKLADEAICIGSIRDTLVYLDADKIIKIAKEIQADAIHPGYGYLSENSEFIAKVEKSGLIFIGPRSETVKLLGDKINARNIAKNSGVEVVNGSECIKNLEMAKDISKNIGYPILLKARNGGGGKGIRLIKTEKELIENFEITKAEVKKAFGDDGIYIEKYIENPKHIEVQILADKYKNIVSLGIRNCSIQLDNQKMIEESFDNILDKDTTHNLNDMAIKIAKSVNYQSAGTVEFLVDKDNNIFFIEMNTRIQVEHPVTEMTTGIDIVKEQIKIANGKKLNKDISIRGHSIEVRIIAKDPINNFFPSCEQIKFLHLPQGMGVRIDTEIFSGYKVSPYFDGMLAKIIVQADTRMEAIRKLRRVLEEIIIEGVKTNIWFLYAITYDFDFIRGRYSTKFINDKKEYLIDRVMVYDKLLEK